MRPRVIDQNASHQLSRDAKKLRPVAPVRPLLVGDFQVKLVHQCGGLQCVLAAFSAKVGGGQPVQFVVDKWHQLLKGVPITVVPPCEQLSDAFRRTFRHLLTKGIHIRELQ